MSGPERIWYDGTSRHSSELRWQAPSSDIHPQTKYIRADLVQKLVDALNYYGKGNKDGGEYARIALRLHKEREK